MEQDITGEYPHPKYLGVTLNRTLGYKQQIHNTNMKVAICINLLIKLSNSKWGANVNTIRTTALALSYSVTEYTAPVWARSPHAQKLNTELNSAWMPEIKQCRIFVFASWNCATQHQVRCNMLEWKRPNRKPMRPTLYMGNTLQ